MTRSVLFVAAALALTVTAAQAAEDVDSANALLQDCRELADRTLRGSSDFFSQGYCAGTISGITYAGYSVRDLLQTFPSASDAWMLKRAWCLDIPDGVTRGQEVRVVVAYIEARPARMHQDFRRLALEALRAAWPCK